MPHRLAPHIHAAFIGERAIVLDVTADRYRMLSESASAALRALDDKVDDLDAGRRALEAAGIITMGQGGLAFTQVPQVTSSITELDPMPGAGAPLRTVAHALLAVMIRLRFRGLAAVLADVRSHRLNDEVVGATVISLAQAYARQRRRLPFHQVCLADSVALHRLLSSRGKPSTLVIGVRLDPFAAHCWLQSDTVVLNDSCDTVSRFTPILAI